MEPTDYPSLWRAADKASQKAQSGYSTLMSLDLAFMIAGSLLAIYNFQGDTPKVWIYAISGVVLLAATILTFVVKIQKFEEIWYQGRALAESVKTLSWRFMTCSDSFEASIPPADAETIFITRLQELSAGFTDLNQYLDANILSEPVITDKLREARRKTFQERKALYLSERIEDQKRWYSDKAAYNQQKQNTWFIIILCTQFLAICATVYLVKFPSSNWNIVGLLTTISSAAIAWLQLKQHQELKLAYTTAALELNFIKEKSINIQNEEELSGYVLDSENAISREHTLWLAQKRK